MKAINGNYYDIITGGDALNIKNSAIRIMTPTTAPAIHKVFSPNSVFGTTDDTFIFLETDVEPDVDPIVFPSNNGEYPFPCIHEEYTVASFDCLIFSIGPKVHPLLK